MPEPEPLLIPRPTRMEIRPGVVSIPKGRLPVSSFNHELVVDTIGAVRQVSRAGGGIAPWAECRLEGAASGAAAQGYELVIDSDSASPVRLTAPAAAGLRHGLHTLAQLLRQFPDKLPAMRISDLPRFAVRGVMLDVSRDRVPTMEHLLATVTQLAELKINHLQLYTEHTFAYQGHEEVWRDWSPMTPAQVRELDQHCHRHGVDLAANQNCFGHLGVWLRHPRYAHLAETHGDWMFDVWPRSGPFSICPTDPASERLIADLLGQLLPCFSGPNVNIGCDETYDISYGRSREQVLARGRSTVYLEFVARIAAIVRSHGKRPMFWADIALHEPESVASIPPDLLALAWGYEPHSPFAEWCRILADAGRKAWVCPGTSSWRSIFGRTAERTGNLRAAAACAAEGYLVCDWGDTGHHQQWPISLHALAHGAAAAWSGTDHAGHDGFDPRAESLHVFGDRSLRIGPWLEEIGDIDRPLRETCGRLSRPMQTGSFALWNQSAFFADMHNAPTDALTEVGELAQWASAEQRAIELESRIPNGLPPLLDAELRHTMHVARWAARRAVARREPGGLSPQIRASLAESLAAITAEHTRLWSLTSRPGGLVHSLSFYTKVLDGLTAESGSPSLR